METIQERAKAVDKLVSVDEQALQDAIHKYTERKSSAFLMGVVTDDGDEDATDALVEDAVRFGFDEGVNHAIRSLARAIEGETK